MHTPYCVTRNCRTLVLPARGVRQMNTANAVTIRYPVAAGENLIVIGTSESDADPVSAGFIQLTATDGYTYTIPIALDGAPTVITVPENIIIISLTKSGTAIVSASLWRERSEPQIVPSFEPR